MSEAVAGRGDMKPEEGGSEPGTSQELLQRLRELEVRSPTWLCLWGQA